MSSRLKITGEPAMVRLEDITAKEIECAKDIALEMYAADWIGKPGYYVHDVRPKHGGWYKRYYQIVFPAFPFSNAGVSAPVNIYLVLLGTPANEFEAYYNERYPVVLGRQATPLDIIRHRIITYANEK